MRSGLGWVVGVWLRRDVVGPKVSARWRWAPGLAILLFVAAEAGATQLTASWTSSPSSVEGYSVERAVSTTGTFAEVGRPRGAVTSFTDSSVTPGTTSCYRVRAFNGHGTPRTPTSRAPARRKAMVSSWYAQILATAA